jgi:hypothetical protein
MNTVPAPEGCSGAMHMIENGDRKRARTTSFPILHDSDVPLMKPLPVTNTGVRPPVTPERGVTAVTRKFV